MSARVSTVVEKKVWSIGSATREAVTTTVVSAD